MTAGDDPLFKMNAYTSYLATKRGEAEVIWSRAYEDAFGLGRVVTAARPILVLLAMMLDLKTLRLLHLTS